MPTRPNMQKIFQLDLGFSDAENYKLTKNKQVLVDKFVHTAALDKVCDRNAYFIVGEKGTGKTAYAVYITNTAHRNNLASTRYIRETDYLKFISLKSAHQLDLSDYVDVWKVVIYLLLSEQVLSREKSKLSLPQFSAMNRL